MSSYNTLPLAYAIDDDNNAVFIVGEDVDSLAYDYNLYKLLANNSFDFVELPFASRMEVVMSLTYAAYIENGRYMTL